MESLLPDRDARLRVVALGLLGYAYVLGVFLGLLLVAVGAVLLLPSVAVVVWVGLPLALVALGFLRALWVRSPAPEGVRLEPRDAPGLFALLLELRAELRAPRLHQVRLVAEFNASVAQYPRLGILGPYRNVLTLGLPLLQALPEAELRAVLAHELAHVSRRHGRTAAWVYRLRVAWERVSLQLDLLGAWGLPFRPFVRWYVPRFDRASYALARAHEREADRAAAVAGGVETTASALVRIALGDFFLSERFWPDFWKRALHEADPPAPLVLLARRLAEVAEDPGAEGWIHAALDAEPVRDTTHPVLRERLAALGLDPERVRPRPARVSAPAADVLLPARAELTAELDRRWQDEAGPFWREHYDAAREAEARLAELEAHGNSPTELSERARLVSGLHGLAAARPEWEQVLAAEPDDVDALVALGELAAEDGDPRAHDLLERAAAVEPLAAPHALGLRAALLAREGHRSEAAACRRRAAEAAAVVERAHAERSRHLAPGDGVVEHDLPAEKLGAIVAVLDRKEIARAYVARKEAETLGDRLPVYVVAYVRRGSALRLEKHGASAALEAELFAALEGVMPGPFWLADLTADSSRLHRRLRKLDGACVVRRGRSARPLARAAPVLVGVLLIGGLVTRFADDNRPAAPPPGLTQAALVDARYRWAAQAEDVCAVQRTHANLRLEDVVRERGELDFAQTWAVVRPFQQQVVDILGARPAGDDAARAVGLLARDLRRLDRIAGAVAAGRGKAAGARLERFEADDSTARAFAELGVHECAPAAPLVR
jgi:Zn-dependent protease with chaperone function